MTDFLELARDRYSCRAFTDRPVEPEKVDALLAAAVAAPTAVDRQPWRAWVVESPEAVERLSACTRFSFGARVFVVVGAVADEAWVRKYDGRNFADVDASIVATHVMLAAHDLGLGTTWWATSTPRRWRRPSPRWLAATSWPSSRWDTRRRRAVPRPSTSSDGTSTSS